MLVMLNIYGLKIRVSTGIKFSTNFIYARGGGWWHITRLFDDESGAERFCGRSRPDIPLGVEGAWEGHKKGRREDGLDGWGGG